MVQRLLPGALVTLAGIVLLVYIIPFAVPEPGYTQPNSLAPSDFPTYLSWVILVTGLLILVFNGRPGNEAVAPGEIRVARTAAFLAGLVLFILAIPILGIEASAFLFTLGLFVLASDLTVLSALIIAGALAICINLIFVEAAGVPIPTTLDWIF